MKWILAVIVFSEPEIIGPSAQCPADCSRYGSRSKKSRENIKRFMSFSLCLGMRLFRPVGTGRHTSYVFKFHEYLLPFTGQTGLIFKLHKHEGVARDARRDNNTYVDVWFAGWAECGNLYD